MLVATFSSHAYWNFTDVAQRRIQDSVVLEEHRHDSAACCCLFVAGPGKWSLDHWLAKK